MKRITLNLLKHALLALSVVLLAASCKKDVTEDLTPVPGQKGPDSSGESSFFRSDEHGENFESLCFQISYPVTVILPGSGNQIAQSDEELFTIVNDWYLNHPDSNEDPTLEFPIEVTLEDGSIQSVADEDALESVFEDCFEFEDEWDECFSINFPVTVAFPDGTTATAGSEEELESIFAEWEANHPNSGTFPALVFPLEVTLEDGSTQTVNDEYELVKLFEDCFGDWDDHMGHDDEWELCFDIIYPVNVLFPDGTSQTANSDEELDELIFAWFENHPNATDFPTLEFPVQVDLDGEVITLNNEQELEELLEECDDLWDDEGNPFEECFTFNYPITVLFPDNTSAAVNSDEELEMSIENWYTQNPDSYGDPSFAYPLEVTLLEDGSVVVVNSDEELGAIIENCFECLVANPNGLTTNKDEAVIVTMAIKHHPAIKKGQQAKLAKVILSAKN